MSNLTDSGVQAVCSNGQAGMVMLEQLLSQGDSQFQQGNFSEACEFYAQALSNIDDQGGDDKQLASVVQKLADSEYALNKFTEARAHYERLVKLQQSTQAAPREKVMVLQKLAKSSDKLDLQDDAQKYFTAAYELGKATLPKTNFLNRSVMDSYAEWLRTTGRNAGLLADIETELGIEKPAAPAPHEPEVTAETVKVATATSGVAREQEQFVVKAKLTKFRKQKQADEARGSDEAKKKLEASDKTLDQQVAERKFLRKTEDKPKTDTTKSRRAKLRNAMSEEVKRPADADIDFSPDAGYSSTTSGDYATLDRDAVSGSNYGRVSPNDSGRANKDGFSTSELDSIGRDSAAGRGGARSGRGGTGEVPGAQSDPELHKMIAALDAIPSSGPQPVYNVPVNIELDEKLDPAVVKLIAKKPRRHFSDRLEASREKKDLETKVMSEQSRSFLQHAELVKRATDPNSEQAPDVVQMKEQEKTIPVQPKVHVAKVAKIVAPILAIALLGIASTMLLKQSTAPRAVAIPSFALNLVGKSFSTADDVVTVQPDRKDASISGALRRTSKIHYWSGDLNDEISLVKGEFKNSKWLFPCQEGLKDEKGVLLYAKDSPERKVVAVMNDVAEQAAQYFITNHDYPSFSTNLTKPGYTNPFTKAAEEVAVFSGVDNRAEGAVNSKLDIELRNSKKYNNETPLHPGAVHALSIIGQPEFSGEDNNYNWQTHCFYVRACGRDGKYLSGSVPKQAFVLTLKNGQPMRANAQEATSDYATKDICISENAPPDATGIFVKYVGGTFVIVLILLLAMRSGTMTASGRRRL